jgi:ribonuclease E
MLIKGATHNLIVRTRAEVALYVLNHKRAHLRALEERFRITITVSADPAVTGQQSYVIDRGEQVHTPEAARNLAAQQPQIPVSADEAEEDFVAADGQEEDTELAAAEPEGEARLEGGERESGRKRRRRRGRGGRGRGGEPRRDTQSFTHDTVPEHTVAHEDHDGGLPEEDGSEQQQSNQEGDHFGEGEAREGARRRRRRGRRGGRRNRQRNGERPPFQGDAIPESEAHRPDEKPPYESGPVYAAPVEHHPAPPPEEPATAASEQDVRRRRSTIREPVAFSGEAMAPPPANFPPATPVVSSSGADEPATPKRGWWGKRLLGDKS